MEFWSANCLLLIKTHAVSSLKWQLSELIENRLHFNNEVLKVQLIRIIFLIAFILFSCLALAEPPHQFPQMNSNARLPILLIAKLSDGAYLPQFSDCNTPRVICMDPPPFWLRAKILTTIYGQTVSGEIYPVTTSHYGMGATQRTKGQTLLLLMSDGQYFVMPRYASANLIKDKKGEFYLALSNPNPISWLPCSAIKLKQEIVRENFSRSLRAYRVKADGYHFKQYPDAYKISGKYAFPRYAIPITALSEHLKNLNPTADEMFCEND